MLFKNYHIAEKYFLKILELAPTNMAALSFLVRHYNQNRNYQKGIKILKKTANSTVPGAKSNFIIANLSDFYFKNNQPKQAIFHLKAFLEKFEATPYILKQLALSHLAIDDKAQAMIYYKKILTISNGPSFYYATIRRIYLNVNPQLSGLIYCDNFCL